MLQKIAAKNFPILMNHTKAQIKKLREAGRVAQRIEHLLSKHDTLR
jgi:hypothetical protein